MRKRVANFSLIHFYYGLNRLKRVLHKIQKTKMKRYFHGELFLSQHLMLQSIKLRTLLSLQKLKFHFPFMSCRIKENLIFANTRKSMSQNFTTFSFFYLKIVLIFFRIRSKVFYIIIFRIYRNTDFFEHVILLIVKKRDEIKIFRCRVLLQELELIPHNLKLKNLKHQKITNQNY